MTAAIHLGDNYNDNVIAHQNTNFDALKKLFDITQKLSLDQKNDIKNVSTIEWQFTSWMRSLLLHAQALKFAKAKVRVYSDSVLRLGNMCRHPEAKDKCKDQL